MVMLRAKDNSWVMAMPSKCGSTGMYHLQKHTDFCDNVGGWHGGWKMDKKEQSMVQPCRQRLLLVREPLSRYVSLYWFILNRHYKEFTRHTEHLEWFRRGEAGDTGESFDLFIRWVGDPTSTASKCRMFWTFEGYARNLKPHHLVRMEYDLISRLRTIGAALPKDHPYHGDALAERYREVGKNRGKGRLLEDTVPAKSSEGMLAVLRREYDAVGVYPWPVVLG